MVGFFGDPRPYEDMWVYTDAFGEEHILNDAEARAVRVEGLLDLADAVADLDFAVVDTHDTVAVVSSPVNPAAVTAAHTEVDVVTPVPTIRAPESDPRSDPTDDSVTVESDDTDVSID